MNQTNEKVAFSLRLNRLLDDAGVDQKGDGRQIKVAAWLEVSQAAARKWLEGQSVPTFERVVRLAKRLNANVEWLYSGRGPMRPGDVAEIDYKVLREILETLVSHLREMNIELDGGTIADLAITAYQDAVTTGTVDRSALGHLTKGATLRVVT